MSRIQPEDHQHDWITTTSCWECGVDKPRETEAPLADWEAPMNKEIIIAAAIGSFLGGFLGMFLGILFAFFVL